MQNRKRRRSIKENRATRRIGSAEEIQKKHKRNLKEKHT
jgi:hypothetical protein